MVAAGAGVALVGPLARSAAAADGDQSSSCSTTTVWMLATDWSEPRGPHGKTRLVSTASRNAATYRIARSEQDALDMNLHLCSWAPASATEVCTARVDAAFAEAGQVWHNPWNGRDIELVDLRHTTALADGAGCGTCAPAVRTVSGGRAADLTANGGASTLGANGEQEEGGLLAFTGAGPTERRLLFLGAASVGLGFALQRLSSVSSSLERDPSPGGNDVSSPEGHSEI